VHQAFSLYNQKKKRLPNENDKWLHFIHDNDEDSSANIDNDLNTCIKI